MHEKRPCYLFFMNVNIMFCSKFIYWNFVFQKLFMQFVAFVSVLN